METFHLALGVPKSLIFCTFSSCEVVGSRLLRGDASLMMSEQDIDLWL